MDPQFLMRDEIADHLACIRDEGTTVDTGRTGDLGTIWFTVDGEDYSLHVEHHVKKGS